MLQRVPPHQPSTQSQAAASSGEARTLLFDLTLRVVTPMFGGSACARAVDAAQPVTAKSVRGHLRFWWRACVAHRYDKVADLFAAEAAIWGRGSRKGDDHPPGSPIDVEVTVLDANSPETPLACRQRQTRHGPRYDLTWKEHWPGYALFRFQSRMPEAKERSHVAQLRTYHTPAECERALARESPKAAEALTGVRFKLQLFTAAHLTDAGEIATLRAEAEKALWAWITFGGVGSGSRRGCGALWCENERRFQPNIEDNRHQDSHRRWILREAGRHVAGAPAQVRLPIPMLHGAQLLVHLDAQPIHQAWSRSVGTMQRFRQGEGVGRDPGTGGVPGMSRWPEAMSIRRITGKASAGHEPANPNRRLNFFPRANLGLPIVFHFKQPDDEDADRDPDDMTLAPARKGATRMASPFVLKPLAASATHGFALVLLMRAPNLALRTLTPDGHMPLELSPGVPLENPRDITDLPGGNQDRTNAVQPMNNNWDVRAAFLESVRDLWGLDGATPLSATVRP